MSKSENRPRRVFIIGAGMSAECGAPLIDEFLDSDFFPDFNETPYYGEPYSSLRNFISDVYLERSNPNIEMILSLVDNAVARREKLGKYTIPKLQQLRKNIVQIIGDVLTDVYIEFNQTYRAFPVNTTPILTKKVEGYRDTYFQLIRNILNVGDTIITFNYDRFLDHALNPDAIWNSVLEKFIGNRDKVNYEYIDFGTEFLFVVGWEKPKIYSVFSDQPQEQKTNTLTILKLHGGLNWDFCYSCESLVIYGDFSFIEHFHSKETKHCCVNPKFSDNAFIVPPTWMKDYNNRALESVHAKAFHQLTRADEVIFLGYSFSEADYQIRYLFNRALATRQGKNWSKIVVVDPDKKGRVEERYKKFFGDKTEMNKMKASEYLASFPR